MSNAAYLITTDDPGPTIGPLGEHRFESNEVLADGPCAVPILWLALFDQSHLVEVDVSCEGDESRVPSLVADAAEATGLLAARADLILDAFPEFGPTRDAFARLVGRSKRHYLKVDLEEIWNLDPDDFGLSLDASLRWFGTRDAADFRELLAMANVVGYDPARRTFPGESGVPRAFHFRGYASRDSAWSNEADI